MTSSIEGVELDELVVHGDDRGSFAEVMRASKFPVTFVQSNHSRSAKGVLRGLHYHRKQADLWYVIAGRMRVGLADLRTQADPPIVETIDLAAAAPAVLFIPPGVAHGFFALEDVDLLYWVSNYYDGDDEMGIAWDDPTLAVPWDADDPILSERDRSNPPLQWQEIAPF